MLISEVIVEVLGAGLSSSTRETLKGELDGYRRAHRSGRPVSDRELLPIAVTATASARFRRVNAEHLPTLVSVGGVLVMAGTLLTFLGEYLYLGYVEPFATTYLTLALVEIGLIGAFLCRRPPIRSLAVGSCLLSVALLSNLNRQGASTAVLTYVVMHVVMLGVAVAVPFLFVSLAWKCRRRPRREWSELPALVRSDPLTFIAARILTFVLLAAMLSRVAVLALEGGHLSWIDRITVALVAMGHALQWAGAHAFTTRSAA